MVPRLIERSNFFDAKSWSMVLIIEARTLSADMKNRPATLRVRTVRARRARRLKLFRTARRTGRVMPPTEARARSNRPAPKPRSDTPKSASAAHTVMALPFATGYAAARSGVTRPTSATSA